MVEILYVLLIICNPQVDPKCHGQVVKEGMTKAECSELAKTYEGKQTMCLPKGYRSVSAK